MSNLLIMGAKTMDKTDFCTSTANIWQFVGYFLFWFKIIIPLLIIILGMIDLGKAVVAQKDDEIKKATSSIIKRVVIGIVIFFIPTIVYLFFGLVGLRSGDDKNDKSGIQMCYKCLLKPFKTKCEGTNVTDPNEA